MTSELDHALAAVPGYTESRAALDALIARAETTKTVNVEAEISLIESEVEALALAGEPLPEDFGARIVAARQSNDAASAETAVLNRLRERLHAEVDDTIRRGADAALSALAERMAALFGEVREHDAALGGAQDAREIMRKGAAAVEAWAALDALFPRYQQLRDAQHTLTGAAFGRSLPYGSSRLPNSMTPPEATRLLKVAGEFKNSFDVLPEYGWDPSRMQPQLRNAPWGIDGDPWNTNPPEVIPAQRRYNMAYLRWAANPTGGAVVWLPTVAELTEAVRVNEGAVKERLELARVAHTRRAGVRDITPYVVPERRRVRQDSPGEYPVIAEKLSEIKLPESFTS